MMVYVGEGEDTWDQRDRMEKAECKPVAVVVAAAAAVECLTGVIIWGKGGLFILLGGDAQPKEA